jgi:uncharacterized membrane protein YhaH (DUF805 family)
MSPIAWAIRPLKRYAEFGGRSPRAEYWWFVALQWLLLAVAVLIAVSIAGGTGPQQTSPLFNGFIVPVVLGFLGLLIPNIAVQVRRLHDQDRSGWFILLFAIPYVGSLICIIFMLVPGTRGENRFGPDPLGLKDDHLERVFA